MSFKYDLSNTSKETIEEWIKELLELRDPSSIGTAKLKIKLTGHHLEIETDSFGVLEHAIRIVRLDAHKAVK